MSEEIQGRLGHKESSDWSGVDAACREEGTTAASKACGGECVHKVLLLPSVYSKIL